jgi:hypothetical protein
MKTTAKSLITTLAIITICAASAFAQGTAFTYQGRLSAFGTNANGFYDLRFNVYDALSGGSLVAGPKTNSPVLVSNGIFTVTIDFGSGVFTGPQRFLEIGARTNGVAVAFSVLSPRQELTPTPYAITSENLDGSLPASQLTGTLPSGLLAGTYANPVTFNNPADVFAGNGTAITNVNAVSLQGLGPNSFWKVLGNAGTTPGLNFAGTTDNQPFELKANSTRALRLEPGQIFSGFYIPNVIGGSPANFSQAGTVGNFIGGGGSAGEGYTNSTSGGNYDTIAGGVNNQITNSYEATIGGGYNNTVGNTLGTIGGGYGNAALGNAATVPGGYNNLALGAGSFAAGENAQALHDGSFVWADLSSNSSFGSGGANQFVVRSSFMGINRNFPLSGNEFFGITTPLSNTWGGMYIQTPSTGRPFYGYNNPSGTAWTELDGTDTNKWKIYNGGYQLAVTTSGQVGIGTMTPTDKLDVEGTVRINDNPLYLRGGTDHNHGIAYSNVVSGISIDGPFIWGYNGGALGGVTTVNPDVVTLHWDWQGNVWISNNCSVATLTIRGGADLAEPFQITATDQAATEGSVLVIDEDNPGHLKLSDRPYDTRVAGVISGANGVNPGIQMQQQGLIEGGKNVALTGRVYVQADASFGAIKPGDMLTTSSTPGHAMKVSNHAKAQGAILGKAMTGLKNGRGSVLVLVTLQ